MILCQGKKRRKRMIMKKGNCESFAGEKENDSCRARKGAGEVSTSRNMEQAAPKAIGAE